MGMSLERILDKFKDEVSQFIATAIVDTTSGLALVSTTVDPGFDPAVASPTYAEVVKANTRALSLLGMDPKDAEDIVITTTTALLLIRVLPSGHYHGLAIPRTGNLEVARVIMRKYEPVFLREIQRHFG